MKKITILIVLAMLCLNFRVSGQANLVGKGLSPGDMLPDSAGLSSYKGKLLILDFWATWCSPCRYMTLKGDSLNTVFAGKALILPVTYETEKVALPVLAKIRNGANPHTPEIFGDKVLRQIFPHRTLPHYVWIDASGWVRAITDMGDVNAHAIRLALEKRQFPAEVKHDYRIAYTPEIALFREGNAGNGEGVIYQSMLSAYVPGLNPGLTITRFDTIIGQKITLRNNSLQKIFAAAHGERGRHFIKARILNLSKDSARMSSRLIGNKLEEWYQAGNAFCYELIIPPHLSSQTYPLFQSEIARLFPQYSSIVEKRTARCLALVRTGNSDSAFKSKGEAFSFRLQPFLCKLRNTTFGLFVQRLEMLYLQNSPLPVVDMTGYTGRIDLEISAAMSNVPELNRALAPYGLRFEEREAETDFLVIRDRPQLSTSIPKPKP